MGSSRASPRPRLDRRSDFRPRRRTVPALSTACVLAILAAIALISVQRPPVDFRTTDRPGARTPVRSDSADAGPGSPSEVVYRQIRWSELAPSGWDPYKEARGLRERGRALKDDDPEAKQLVRKLRDLWDFAPTNPEIAGKPIRIPGYVVPLETNKSGLSELMLVPYFGACIHTPPPPSNQILNVKLERPLRGVRTMETVWVEGTIRVRRSETSAGYAAMRFKQTSSRRMRRAMNGADRSRPRRRSR
jgi:hypothetical protein